MKQLKQVIDPIVMQSQQELVQRKIKRMYKRTKEEDKFDQTFDCLMRFKKSADQIE